MGLPRLSGVPEEARESWDYVVSDKIVDRCEIPDPQLQAYVTEGINWLSKYDLSFNRIELDFVLVDEIVVKFKAVVQFATAKEIRAGNVYLPVAGLYGENSMLIDDAEFVKHIERMHLVSRRSVIRLKRFDNWNGSGKDILDSIAGRERPWSARRSRPHRERRMSARVLGTSVQERELPSQLVEAGTKGIRKFASEKGDGLGHGVELKPYNVPLFLAIILTCDGVCVLKELCKFSIKFVEMLLRPVGFHLRIDEAVANCANPHASS